MAHGGTGALLQCEPKTQSREPSQKGASTSTAPQLSARNSSQPSFGPAIANPMSPDPAIVRFGDAIITESLTAMKQSPRPGARVAICTVTSLPCQRPSHVTCIYDFLSDLDSRGLR